MGMKIHLCLLLTILGITAYAQGSPDLPKCDWPNGVCVYYKDQCPPDIPYECRNRYDCPLGTNKCCCRRPPGLPKCDWPHGVCVYYKDPCPPDIPYPCQDRYDCPVSTNKCCCRSP
ncbi:small cysteine-rich protein 5-like [Oculina patagonica]